MEVHQLRYFAAVAAEGSFTAAAARLHVSQSGVSTQLAKLERELGQRLFIRGRTLGLTPAGRAILPLAREALAGLDAIARTAAAFADTVRGPVRVGMVPGYTPPGFLDVVAGLGRTDPGITLRVNEGDVAELQHGILDRTLDIALIGYAGPLRADFVHHLVSEEELHAFAAPGIALGPSPRLAEVQRHPVLCLPPGSGIRAAYEQSCARAGIEARIDMEASSPLTLLGLAGRGGGVAVLPSAIAAPEGITAAPIEDAHVHARLGLISHHEQLAPAVRVVLGKLVEALSPGR
ncbi:LysR family transcriptional regulator [Kitasatospora sp. NPDC015120]|uniref:LysR family transcriptional regulator n=1 Tax=Kitasatospora sp. NPDC015120 TaxID=3364023 RepID=UPI0036F451BE